MQRQKAPSCLLALLLLTLQGHPEISLTTWTRLDIDVNRTDHDFGIHWGDVNRDGELDLVDGVHVHINPGGDMSGDWARYSGIGSHDGSLLWDWDSDGVCEMIAQDLPDVWYYRTEDGGKTWQGKIVGSAQREKHGNAAQGQYVADIEEGGAPEVVLASGPDRIVYLVVPGDPWNDTWEKVEVTGADDGTHEGVGIGDIDGDGDLDMAGHIGGSSDHVRWWANPGDGSGNWQHTDVGKATQYVDRCRVADFNGDGQPDIAVTCTYDGDLWWFENQDDGTEWTGHKIGNAGGSSHGLDWADLDRDGDIDLVSGTTTDGDPCKVWENTDGKGTFEDHTIANNAGFHNSGKLVDLDQDGDLDIVGYGWATSNNLIVLRNDGIPPGKEGTVPHDPNDPDDRNHLKLRYSGAEVGTRGSHSSGPRPVFAGGLRTLETSAGTSVRLFTPLGRAVGRAAESTGSGRIGTSSLDAPDGVRVIVMP